MNHQFNVKIDPILGTGHILLNQQALFSQSQLQICTTQNFFDWYLDLPDLMFAEVNDNYYVCVECLDIQFDLLRTVFSSVAECHSLTHIPLTLNFSVEQRFVWLNEIALKTGFSLPEVPKFSVQTQYSANGNNRTSLPPLPAFYEKYHSASHCQVNIWIVTSNGAVPIPPDQLTDNDLILGEGGATGVKLPLSTPIIYQDRRKWTSTIATWIDQMVLLPYLQYCQEALRKRNKSTSFELDSRVHMLTRDEPFVQLIIPSRIETGSTCKIELKEFPSSNLSLHISDPSLVVQKNDQLFAQKPGHAKISVTSNSGNVLQEKILEIYFVNRVTSISLASGKGSTILLGDNFTITADCRPQGAENLSKAVWSVSPTNALKNIGGGQFTALASGKCTVTLTIEKVSTSIPLIIAPLSTDIRLPPEIRFKVNAAPQRVTAVLLPNGSACKEIRCTVPDGNIAQWNPNTKSIVPISEGTTRLEATAIGPTGNVLFSKSCPVIILPEKDIITPPALLTLAICCAILALLTGGTMFFPIALTGCILLFGSCAIVNGIPWLKHQGTKSNKIQTSIAIAGTIISIILLIIAL